MNEGPESEDAGVGGKRVETDWFLESLVRIVTTTPMEMGLTVIVGGSTISGLLVSGKAYFEGVAEEVSEAMRASWVREKGSADPGVVKSVRDSLAAPASMYEPDKPIEIVSYLHLKEARVYAPGAKAMPENRGVWMRVRLSEIGAFTIGSLT